MPQPCILLKIQHIHYRFTWQKKGAVGKCNVPAQLCPSFMLESGICTRMNLSLICQTCSTGHRSQPRALLGYTCYRSELLVMQSNNCTSIPGQEHIQKAARKSHSSLQCPSVGQEGSEAHYARAVEPENITQALSLSSDGSSSDGFYTANFAF